MMVSFKSIYGEILLPEHQGLVNLLAVTIDRGAEVEFATFYLCAFTDLLYQFSIFDLGLAFIAWDIVQYLY